MKYYSLDGILRKNADYNIVFGERSNGKTYAALKHCIEQFYNNCGEFAYIRRWKEDILGKRAANIFAALESNDDISKLTNGEYTRVKYYNGVFYLANWDENTQKLVADSRPCGYTFALSDSEHNKSVSYPNVTNVVFDEFLTRRYYLVDEFVTFMNVLSTIIRQRDNVKIFMLGNTVNKYCPYFAEMGLRHVKDMKQGSIDVYKYGKSGLTVAVEYAGASSDKGKRRGKKSDKYFAFDNKNLEMITQGKWELALYPHLPERYKRSQVLFTYFIDFQGDLLQCEIVQTDNGLFTYVHEKTTPLQDPKNDIVFSDRHEIGANYYRRLLHPRDELSKKIGMFYATEKVFFQNNDCGEIVRNYIRTTETSQFAS
jgi:hypothetical protein